MPGPSGYTTAFTHPDPLDPNDAQRQRTQARTDDYPYDMPVMYGRPVGTDMGGASYQRLPDVTPPHPQNKGASKMIAKKASGQAWEQLESMLLSPYGPGSQAYDAPQLGYGKHGLMGDDGMDPHELDMDALRQDFRDTFLDTLPRAHKLGSKGLFSLLVQVDPEYSAELFAPDDDSEMIDTYNDWGQHVFAPGAEDDPE